MTAVLPTSRKRDAHFSPDHLRPPTAQTYFLENQELSFKSPPMSAYYPTDDPGSLSASVSSTILSSDFSRASSDPSFYSPNTLGSLSFNVADEEAEESDGILLPTYEADDYSHPETNEPAFYSSYSNSDPSSRLSPGSAVETVSNLDTLDTRSPDLPRTAGDDLSIEDEPSRHVDYLSHDWKEEDIWASWRYVVGRRSMYSNGVRLENASWRTWAKLKYNLRTVSPETLNWLKDCDVTWLYGPLRSDSKQATISNISPPPSGLSSTNSFLDRKPILKKKTASEAILQRSLTQHTLIKHASAILKAKQAGYSRGRPNLERAISDFVVPRVGPTDSVFGSLSSTPTCTSSSSLVSPTERRHIHFNNEVVQYIAVEARGGDDEDEDRLYPFDSDDESDDSLVMMKQVPSKAHIYNRSNPCNGLLSGESKTIAPLPSTTLKYRGDTPEPLPEQKTLYGSWLSASKLSPTPSIETLRPPRPEANFLLDDDYRDDLDFGWPPKRPSPGPDCDRPLFVNPDDDELETGNDLHEMFLPYEEEDSSHTGLLGKVLDTVNTARDIAHVIWNVGWRR